VKILKYILLAIVLMGTEQITLSQYYLQVKSNSISLKSDSVFMYLDKYRGAINWQASSDLKNWVSLNKHKDTLGIRIDSSAYYRATIIEGDCKPVMSDTVFLIEKLTITNSSQFTVDSLGGVFLLPSGIKVKIPVGAVTTPKEIKVDLFGYDNANTLGAFNISENTAFLTGFSIATDLFHFSKPIKIKIPIQNIDVKSLPVLYELNRMSSTWLLSEETIIVSTKDKFVEIILTGSDQKTTTKGTKSGTSTQGIKSELGLNDIRSFFLNLYGDIFLSEDPCRKIGYNVIIRELDKTESGGCTVTTAHEEIEYWGCNPSQKGTNVALALSPQCEPKLHFSPESLKIVKGKSGSIMLKTDIGDYPLSDQVITLSTSGPISASSTELKTDSYGNTSFGVTGIDIGQGVIHLAVAFDYYLNTIYASGNAGMEYHEYDHKQITKYYTINVTVYDVPKVETGSVTNIKCTSATIGGDVILDNYSEVTERGILVNGVKHSAGSGLGTFTINLTGLECNTPYSVKAYAINEAGTGYGNTVTFTTKRLDECILLTTTVQDTACAYEVITSIISDCIITERGFYYGISRNPELTGNKVSGGSGAGTYSTMLGVIPKTTYYVKGYSTTKCGTVYGNEVILPPLIDSITDIDGNIYKTVKIGTQEWMAENLKTTRLNNGTVIPEVPGWGDWNNLYPYWCPEDLDWGDPGLCWYDNNPVYKDTYGALYNGYAMHTGKLCPTGWHVPSDSEWVTLGNFLGGLNVAGGKLKETGTTHWSPNIGATNSVCFSALPGGMRYSNKLCFAYFADYNWMGNAGIWWTTSTDTWMIKQGTQEAKLCRVYEIDCDNAKLILSKTVVGWSASPSEGHSVRCVKDNLPGK
jgi:uncharacterized protein (TIGR02145 family)